MAQQLPNHLLLSDTKLNQLGSTYRRLNQRYDLLIKHHYSFEDFLAHPENEVHIHRYFANRHLFEHRKSGIAILLKVFLADPESIFEAVLNVESAIAEAEMIGYSKRPIARFRSQRYKRGLV